MSVCHGGSHSRLNCPRKPKLTPGSETSGTTLNINRKQRSGLSGGNALVLDPAGGVSPASKLRSGVHRPLADRHHTAQQHEHRFSEDSTGVWIPDLVLITCDSYGHDHHSEL